MYARFGYQVSKDGAIYSLSALFGGTRQLQMYTLPEGMTEYPKATTDGAAK